MNGFSDLNSSVSISKPSLSHLAPLEAILFDVDGTLCDSDPFHLIAFQQLLQQFYIENIAGKHNSEVALSLFPDDVPRGLQFCEEKEALYRKLVAEKIKPLDGLIKLTKWIEDRGLKRAAVTNAPKENAELMISKLGLTDFFQAVILGSECEYPKPHPGPYLKALEVLNVSKEHTLVFEDSVSGIKAGVAAGMPVVGLTTGNPASMLVQAKPAFLIENYADPKLWAVLEELDNKESSQKA
ncbi:haloacid dehalogenase-like hydrolase domain-containing protein Sgpp isoform X3 [Raphanus sativus]|uniref:Haloacid dehalogenase-like hydrolase domain-containing protein Sgpp isoform X3 n=1 Tax=Raphanus sativus TaxID=3726 RepID=A0A6J0MRP2_RAPSA|nr:haloacid dehalogenase-like hydrolase domain-containing protein Sgpp isoform X3 [Raphanus sativus]